MISYEDLEHRKQIRIGHLLAEARLKNDVNQQCLADRLHVSRRTLQNWECGASPIPLSKAVDYFTALSEPPKSYFNRYMYGESRSKKKKSRAEMIRRCVEHVHQMTDHDLECFDWIMSEEHGSSASAYMQKTVADLQSPLGGRLASCVLITTQYENAAAMGELTDPDAVQPNMETLGNATQSAALAYRSKRKTYVTDLVTDGIVSQEQLI